MNLNLEISNENRKYLNEELSGPRNGGIQYWFSFPNGYAGSVVKAPFTYGSDEDLWELAVMNDETRSVCYSTPITDDVLGYLNDDEVNHYLDRIKALPIK